MKKVLKPIALGVCVLGAFGFGGAEQASMVNQLLCAVVAAGCIGSFCLIADRM